MTSTLKKDPRDCTKYYVCHGQIAHHFDCAPGLSFDSDMHNGDGGCNYKDPRMIPDCFSEEWWTEIFEMLKISFLLWNFGSTEIKEPKEPKRSQRSSSKNRKLLGSFWLLNFRKKMFVFSGSLFSVFHYQKEPTSKYYVQFNLSFMLFQNQFEPYLSSKSIRIIS